MKYIIVLPLVLFSFYLKSQAYWQQKADYKMYINFNDENHTLKGSQTIQYTNNSPEDLDKLFYHLYFNAFQPGSEMDLRSLSIADPDPRIGSRISQLKPEEIGYVRVKNLTLNGKKVSYKTEGTILEVRLDDVIKSNSTVELKMDFESQVPIQIRRSGRNSKEGIDYSMAQWYPKLCEYDVQGWHANPYIGREFYGVWGNFDVTIEMDKKYIIAASGVLQNADEIGYGYCEKEPKNKPKRLKWNFKAENVHDFVWAADPDYKHISHKAHDGTMLRFFYQENDKTKDNWPLLPAIIDEAFKFANQRYGKYPYPVYSFIQGGDGGMEYPMATLITGERPLPSLVGVSLHELMHSWYQMILGTNEALYAWMDEGFTSFAEEETSNYLVKVGKMPGTYEKNPHKGSVKGYSNFVLSGRSEPLSTHADHFITNTAYSVASYTKGQLCLLQLEYIMGDNAFANGLKRYFDEWKFKHPTSNDFFRVMEKTSGLELDWFKEYWVNTTHVTDYSIDTIIGNEITITRKGQMPMPLDIVVYTKDNRKELHYIPLVLMRGEKDTIEEMDEYKLEKDWPWALLTYKLKLNHDVSNIDKIEIDPSGRLVDVNKDDNVWPRVVKEVIKGEKK